MKKKGISVIKLNNEHNKIPFHKSVEIRELYIFFSFSFCCILPSIAMYWGDKTASNILIVSTLERSLSLQNIQYNELK